MPTCDAMCKMVALGYEPHPLPCGVGAERRGTDRAGRAPRDGRVHLQQIHPDEHPNTAESPHVLQRAIQRFRAHASAALRTPTATRRLESCKFRREVSGRIRSPASHAPRTRLARALHVATPSPCPSRPAMLRPAAHDDGSPRVSSSSSPQYVSRTPRIANSVTCHGSSDSDSSRFGWRAHR